MKKKLLIVLLISTMILAGGTVARAEDLIETNTEDGADITENQNDGNVVVVQKLTITENHFPDANFRKYLQETFDKDGDNILSPEELQDIISIDVSNKGIKSLEGVSRFTFLKSLNCDNNQLTTLEVGGCLYLESLSCKGNQLTTLSSMLTISSLQSLDCSDNQLTSLDLRKMPNLISLHCANNKLSELDINACPNLNDLQWDNNKTLIKIDAEHFPDENFRKYLKETFDKDADDNFSQGEVDDITSIDVNYQSIKSLGGIEYFTGLTSLSCISTGLTSLDVSQNPSLQTLDCTNNQLTALDVSSNLDLQILRCGSNQLTSLDVSKNANLTDLWCLQNQLVNLDVSRNTELKAFTCANNRLTELNISNNKKLTALQCNGNQLTSLDISKNSSLETVECSDNKLSDLKMANNSNLEWLWCINNQLSSLDVTQSINLVSLKCRGNHLSNLDLSSSSNMPIRNSDDSLPDNSWHTSTSGAYTTPQSITADIVSQNGKWTLALGAIVGKENLSRVTLATNGATLSADGTVTFSGSNMPTELVYNYDTKNLAEDTPMTVNVALTAKNIDDQTGNDVTVDTGDLDMDSIYKNYNLNMNANIEIILSQDNPSKDDLDKLTQAAGANGYSIAATYEILMTLYSDGQKVTDITDNFGRIKLTFKVDTSLAGQSAVVYQLHNNSQIIVHDGLTINTDGTVTITVDKFSAFAVSVKKSSDATSKPDTNKPDTSKPDTNKPETGRDDTNKTDSNIVDTKQPETNQDGTDQSDAGKTDATLSNASQNAPKTGDNANVVFWVVVAIMASMTGILTIKRSYRN